MVKLNTKTSIVDYLKSQKQDSSFKNRTTLAAKYGINKYTGTAAQNMALLGKVQTPAPKTAAPIAKPPVAPPVAAPKPTTPTAKPPTTPAAPPTTPVNPVVPPPAAPTSNTGQSGAGQVGNVGTPNVTNPQAPPTNGATPPAAAQPPVDFGKQLQDQVNAMYDAQQKQRLEEFYAARDKGIADIKAQQAALDPQFAQSRNQADVVSAQNMMKLKEQMANQGLMGSGENVSAMLRNQTARQQALSGLDLEQAKQTGELEKGITDLNDPNKELGIKNEISSARQQALLDAFEKGDEVKFRNEQAALAKEQADRDYAQHKLESDRDYQFNKDVSDRDYNYQTGRDVIQDKKDAEALKYQKERDKMSDTQWQKEFDQNKLESDREFKQHQSEFNKNYGLDLKKFLYDQKVTEREWTTLSPAKQKEMALNYKYDLGLKKASGGGGGGGGGSTGGKKKSTTSSSKATSTPKKYEGNPKQAKTKGYSDQSSTYDMKMYKAMYGEQAYSQFLADQKKKK